MIKTAKSRKKPEYEYIEEEETVEVEVPIAKYSDFNAQQVYYEPTTDKVWLVGYFENKTNEQGQDGTGQFWTILNADNLKEAIDIGNYEPYKYANAERAQEFYIVGSLSNGQIVAQDYYGRPYLINQYTWKGTKIKRRLWLGGATKRK